MISQKNTPMMVQYLTIKEKYPDAVLFYRMGDFYEMFHEDAIKASAILEIALTSRNKNQKDAIPMCGIPFRAADTYIAKLIEKGCKVAVCEQVEDPATAKGLVKREVVRVITPGMILNEELLDKYSNNYLLALFIVEGQAGMAWLDISTGIFKTTQIPAVNGKTPEALLDEAMRVDPSEILLPANYKNDPAFHYIRKRFPARGITWLETFSFRLPEARERLLKKFSTRSLKGFGCDHLTAGLSAAGAIMAYVQETQLQDTDHITTLQYYDLNSYLVMDNRSCRNLEIFKNIEAGDKRGSLIGIIDNTVTAMGARLMRNWLRYPLKKKSIIEDRLDAVEDALKQKNIRIGLRTSLKLVYDLERLGSKISMGHGNPKDLLALKTSLLKLPDIFQDLNQLSAPMYRKNFIEDKFAGALEEKVENKITGKVESKIAGKVKSKIAGKVEDKHKEVVPLELTELANLIEGAVREDAPMVINEGGIIKDGFNSELDELIELSRNGKEWILKTGAKEKKKTGLTSLKIKFNKVFGYFIEVSKAQAASVPDHYIRKQTLVNAERFFTEELKEVESKVLNAQEKRAALEYELFCEVRKNIVQKTAAILKMAAFLATVDVLLCFAHTAESNSYIRPEIIENNNSCTRPEIAENNNYTRPEIKDDLIHGILSITDGRHPVVEKMMDGERYVPNTIELNNTDQQLLIITGPNMAGKSTVLRQVALVVLMAQTGSFVPASKAVIPITDRIFTRVGALDNLSRGQSTFMVEMEETANIVNNATHNSLVILDEIGRGTSTFDGLSIAWAVAEYLHDLDGRGVKTLFATHYHELTHLETLKPRVKNYNIAVKEFNDNIIFLRRMLKGATNKSYGIQVARLAGVPDDVVIRAKQILNGIEKQGNCLTPERIPNVPLHEFKRGKLRMNKKSHTLKSHTLKSHTLKSEHNECNECNECNEHNGYNEHNEHGIIAKQMNLFSEQKSRSQKILTRIKALDITAMTPIEALNLLNEIHGELLPHSRC